MNTKLLTTLLAVHRYGSMAEAARRLNVTHGAVAQQIRALEAELNISLVRRAGKAVHLTQAAHRILDASEKILGDISALPALANTNELRGELNLGSGNTVLAGKIPDILEVLAARYPEIRVSIMSGQSSEFHTQVERGALDAAIALEPSFTPSKTMGWHLLSEEPFVMIASRRHEGTDPHLLLEREPFIRYHRESWAGQQIDSYLRQNNIALRERFELASTEAITRLVDKNLGVAIVSSVWEQWRASTDVISMPLKAPCKPRRFGLIWLRSSPRLQLIEAFLDAAIWVYQRDASG
ncbi:LysR family transcriptional regulator [Candidimonas sp. SYP-B2681]|uniref:LysR substrate-binding domain-containing protein n=1 Tax=Candidimonas sp. SYP-B2681 TaxID=2497686 RepID=UPI000F889CF4|nr:LysR substrate-binding domain-containing protein [Candidimonas sp. SYP-B2681]RTZ44397.1 LysR family transcriptional regulator [Candidimonas sp. SYP-B2681]